MPDRLQAWVIYPAGERWRSRTTIPAVGSACSRRSVPIARLTCCAALRGTLRTSRSIRLRAISSRASNEIIVAAPGRCGTRVVSQQSK